jgi:hypothetical protein
MGDGEDGFDTTGVGAECGASGVGTGFFSSLTTLFGGADFATLSIITGVGGSVLGIST